MPSRAGSTGSRIAGFGRYAPERRVDNAELEARFNLEPGWIERRTGIRSRRHAADGETLTDLAARAGAAALEQGGLPPSDVALTLLATSTPDHLLPPSAPLLARRLRLTHAGAIDLAGACAGFVYALALADGFVRTSGRPVLVVAANILSRRINPDDRTSAILFADAAGAVVVAPSPDPEKGVLGADLTSDGSRYDLIGIPAGGSCRPFAPHVPPAECLIRIADGRAVFAAAVRLMVETSRRVLAMTGLEAGDVDRLVPHQANGRIIEAVRCSLGLPARAVVSTIAEFGNASAATIPFSMAAAGEVRPYEAGERVLLTAVGAGLTGGALVYGF